MRNFIIGIVATLLPLGLAGLVIAGLGLLPTSADSSPPAMERRVATIALNAALNRRALHLSNPVAGSDQELIEGLKIYTMNCAVCHGTLDNEPSSLEHSFYPPVPQLILHPVHDPEWHTYDVVRNGIRYTGMPSWRHSLSEQDMWKVTGFLSRIETLPAAVQDYWRQSYGVGPPPGRSHGRSQLP
ncbi:MAG: cytochrome c [Terriglobales bacterium]|jgi:mono/diheme cytochrome c family protein